MEAIAEKQSQRPLECFISKPFCSPPVRGSERSPLAANVLQFAPENACGDSGQWNVFVQHLRGEIGDDCERGSDKDAGRSNNGRSAQRGGASSVRKLTACSARTPPLSLLSQLQAGSHTIMCQLLRPQ